MPSVSGLPPVLGQEVTVARDDEPRVRPVPEHLGRGLEEIHDALLGVESADRAYHRLTPPQSETVALSLDPLG